MTTVRDVPDVARHGGRAPDQVPDALPGAFRAIEIVSTASCFSLAALVAADLTIGWVAAPPSAGAVLAASAGAYLAADLASGIVHFLADTIGSAKTPVLGRKFILPFRTHHDSPAEITHHDFFETNGDSCFFASIVLAVAAMCLDPVRGGSDALWAVFALVLGGLIVLTTQFHKWAHATEVPRAVRWLQRAGIILDPAAHAVHHRAPFDRAYCITSGILNPLIDGIGLLRGPRRIVGDTGPTRDAESGAR